MTKQAKPYREAGGWSMRRRVFGEDLYVRGHKTKTAAAKAMDDLVNPLRARGQPKHAGPFKTTLAQALQDLGMERLPFLKGAPQDARRLNRYLRATGLATLKVKATSAMRSAQSAAPQPGAEGQHQYFEVELEPAQPTRRVPKGLGAHRQAQARQTRAADTRLERLAGMLVADIQPHHVQDFLDELRKVRSPSTLQLERAVLRSCFNYLRDVWCWSAPSKNPAVGLRLPRVNNCRNRVMSTEEQTRLDAAIQECRNQLVGPTMTLLTETAMRSSEPLEYACWGDVDLERKLIRLQDSKTDKRDVPLSPRAIEALHELARLNPPQPQERIVRMSYSALAGAWRRACERAHVDDLHLHDLRHTAATRMALKTGNIFIVKALTGHKTWSQLERYVNVRATDVVAVMHAEQAEAAAPQKLASSPAADNVIRMAFPKQRSG